MNKALTIEELKALQVGDWVWIVDKETPLHTGYYQIHGFAKTHVHFNREACIWVAPNALYGKDWLAYKNKEQAEAKGEIMELPCAIGWTLYYVHQRYDSITIDEFTIDRMLINKTYIDLLCASTNKKDYSVYHFDPQHENVFFIKTEAERRLAELKGEK